MLCSAGSNWFRGLLCAVLAAGLVFGSGIEKPATPIGPAGGALTGTYPNPTILNIVTQGAIPFQGAVAGVLMSDATNLFWNNTNKRLGIGTATPGGALSVVDRTPVTGATLVQIGYDGANTSAVSTLLSVTAGATQGAVNLQEWQNNAGTALSFILPNGTLGLVDTLFAALGAPANGTFTYCSDCTIANPCAAAGTGALAKRLNGVWVCN